MKTLGIIGGIGPESTVDYYRLIIARYRERVLDGSYPSIVINSIDLSKMLSLISANNRIGMVEFLSEAIHRVARAGAEFGLLASNTPHLIFDELKSRSPIPLLSIVEAACEAARALGHRRLGLFGTRFTMEGGFYADVFSRGGISVIAPNPDERAYIHGKYMSELVQATHLPETRDTLLAIAARMKDRDGIDGVILGGTELPLLLRSDTRHEVPFLDTAEFHVRAALAWMLA
jgi:aspartate racemase